MIHNGTPIYAADGKVIGRTYGFTADATETPPESAKTTVESAQKPKAEETTEPKPQAAKTAKKSAKKSEK